MLLPVADNRLEVGGCGRHGGPVGIQLAGLRFPGENAGQCRAAGAPRAARQSAARVEVVAVQRHAAAPDACVKCQLLRRRLVLQGCDKTRCSQLLTSSMCAGKQAAAADAVQQTSRVRCSPSIWRCRHSLSA